MEVNKSYIELLLQLLNKEENINIEEYKEELIVNLYLTLLSLSNLEYTEKLDAKETEIKAYELYYKLLKARNFKINNFKISYIKLLVNEPIDVGTDDKNIYERVIQAIFYYEKEEV